MKRHKADYKHLEYNSIISGIGSLFRGSTRKRWSINLDFVSNPSSRIHFSAVPILARRRVLNPSPGQYKHRGKTYRFMVDNAQSWKTCKLKDCPAYQKSPRGNDSEQFCFIADVAGKQVYIPQLEMARVLFYHDPFMARSSLHHNVLNEDFYIDSSGEKPIIHVTSGAEYPLYYYNLDTSRRFLSWVLMDSHARRSFESISANLLTKKYIRGNYEFWDFQFSPPPLKAVEIEVAGWDDFSSQSFFVWEIKRLDGLPSSVAEEIEFSHPNFEQKVGGRPTRGDRGQGEAPEQFELDDDELSDTDKSTVQLLSETVFVSFKKPFITSRISQKVRIVNTIKGDGNKEVLGRELSANEKEVTGSLPGGAWNNLDDQTDDSHLYLSKFQSFLDMVAVLESKHNCKIVRTLTVKLPKVGESKKHWLSTTQNPRCLAIVELYHDNKPITLLEVDTSDNAAKLSTMMLKTGQLGLIIENIDQVKLGIMKKSLGWPTDLFEKVFTEASFSGIPHPKSKYSGRLAPDEIAPWAQRFVNWMQR